MNRARTLFDSPPAGAAAIGPHSMMLDRSAEAQLAGDTIEARQALGAYLVLRSIDRIIEAQDDDSDEMRDGNRFHVASVIRFVEDLPKVDHVEASHLQGLVTVLKTFDRDGARRLRIGLLAYSWHLEQAGRLEEALDVLAVSAPFYRLAGSDELTNLGMTAGRFHRTLAHWDLADRSYLLGYESAERRHDRRGMLLARLGRSKVLLGRGNLPEARHQIEGVIAEAEGEDLAEVRAWGYADLASALEKQDLPWDSLEANYRAFEALKSSNDRCKVLSNLGASLRGVSALTAAQRAFEAVLLTNADWYLTANAHVELLGIGAELGDELAFRRHWQFASEHAAGMPPSLAIDYRFRVGSGLLRFGKRALADRWLVEALQLAESHRLNEWYFRIEGLRRELRVHGATAVVTIPRFVGHERAVEEIESGLRRYAEALTT